MRAALAAVTVIACGDNHYANVPVFEWNESTAVGAYSLDHLAPDDAALLNAVDAATGGDAVVMFYGHDPPINTSYETIEAVLARAAAHHLGVFTFADLAAGGSPRPGICLSFDDTEVDAWFALRDVLARHAAHVTFFVTEYAQFSNDGRAELHQLYAEGNSIEAHGVNHAYANAYIPAYGLQAYIDNEIQPSIDILRADGFTPVAYAHPGGAHTRELDDALAERIAITRSISGRPK